MEEQLASIVKSLNEIKISQNKLIQSVKNQYKTIKKIHNRFDTLSAQMNN